MIGSCTASSILLVTDDERERGRVTEKLLTDYGYLYETRDFQALLSHREIALLVHKPGRG